RLGQYGIQTDLDQLRAQAASAIERGGTDVLKNLVGTLAELGGMILDIILALVISLYLLMDGRRFWERSLAMIPLRHRGKALFLLVIQQVENNVLAPRISGRAVGLHPLGAMFALLAGFQLAGALGGVFAVPLAGVLWVLLGSAYRNAVAEPRRPKRQFVRVAWLRRPGRRPAPDA